MVATVETRRDRVALGFWIAAGFNAQIVVVSQGFSNQLGEVDPFFSPLGCVSIVLWGAAYAALASRYQVAPAAVLVFAAEKALYAVHWASWMLDHVDTLPTLFESNVITGLFFAGYGLADALFMLFFLTVAYRWRKNLRGPLASISLRGDDDQANA